MKHIKHLGQNFLRDESVLQRIADAAQVDKDDIVLEIGTGMGNLTKYLCQKAKFVYAVEKDTRLCKIAEENLRDYKNVEIINDDILKFSLQHVIPSLRSGQRLRSPAKRDDEESKREILRPDFVGAQDDKHFVQNDTSDSERLKIIGNLPYYITTPIIFKLLGQRHYISDIVIMVQKEVAQRIVARPGGRDYGILSCSVQYYTKPKVLFYVSKSKFFPQPEVDSAVLELRVLDRPSVSVKDEGLFFKIIKAAFNQRRKMLRSSLSAIIAKNTLLEIFKKSGIDSKRRPETLSLEEFAKIANVSLFFYGMGKYKILSQPLKIA